MLKTNLKIKTKNLILGILLMLSNQVSSQLMKFEAPLNQLYQDGLKFLNNGDSLSAYQSIQSAHHFAPNNQDIAFHYHLLSVALEKKTQHQLQKNGLNQIKIKSINPNYILKSRNIISKNN